MEIHVTPLISLANQKIEISISGLSPMEKVTLRASMCFVPKKVNLHNSGESDGTC